MNTSAETTTEQIEYPGPAIERLGQPASPSEETLACCSTTEKRMLGYSTLAIYAVVLGLVIYNFI